jgi:hypothetical protein
MKRTFLTLILCFIATATIAGDYAPLMGKRVTLQALTWHYDKGIGGRVVLPSGESVYVRDPWITKPDGTRELRLPQGKLVSLVGVLTRQQTSSVSSTAPISQGYSEDFSYLSIELESFTIIERVDQGSAKLTPK